MPGLYTVARCRECGFLYQKPRVDDAHLADCYPDHYPRHQEPSPRVPFKGSPGRVKAARWALASGLGYAAFRDASVGLWTRLRARRVLRKIRWDCPPWRGQGRYLDVGCGSGAPSAWRGPSAGRSREWKWTRRRRRRPGASPRRFTWATCCRHRSPRAASTWSPPIHVLEHVPDPVAVLRRMLRWLAPDGLLIVEVPNAGGLGAAMFGKSWSGLELPRHLSHFSPETLSRAVELAGGRVAWCWHGAKPRYYLWSLAFALRDVGWPRLARFTEWRPAYGLLKLLLELTLPLARSGRRGK